MSTNPNIPDFLNKNEIPEGELEYHPNGFLKREKMFINEKLSKEIFYDEGGLIYKIIDYDGQGNIINEVEMGKETSQHGLSFTYYPNGNVQSLKYFINGKVNWVEKIFNEDGQLSDIVTYNKGVKTGPHSIYSKRNAKLSEINYKDNKPSGPAKFYYETGELKAEINYREGKKDGVSKFFHKNGNLKKKESYTEGAKNGFTSIYFENGAIKEKWNFENGQLNNESIKYNMQGEELSKTYFENGSIVTDPEAISQKQVEETGVKQIQPRHSYDRRIPTDSVQKDNTEQTIEKEILKEEPKQKEIIQKIKKLTAEEIRKKKIKLAVSYTGIFIGSLIAIYIIYNIVIYFL